VATTPSEGAWKGEVGVAEHLGADTFVHVNAGELGTINVRASGEVPVHHGDTVWLTPDASKLHRFDATGAAINA
jgi:multiple sugar transport system ATP-binding protein